MHDFSLELGIVAYMNSEGVLAIVNLFTMVRKFIQTGYQRVAKSLKIVEREND